MVSYDDESTPVKLKIALPLNYSVLNVAYVDKHWVIIE